MQTVTLYGASDDLIEIEGDLREEWGAYTSDDEVFHVAISTGTLLRFSYDGDGLWRIVVLDKGAAEVTHEAGSVPDDTCDRVTITAPCIRWMVLSAPKELDSVGGAVQWVKAKKA